MEMSTKDRNKKIVKIRRQLRKNDSKQGKSKLKKSEQEDEEIQKLQESYHSLIDFRDIRAFDCLPLSKRTRKGLLENKFKVPTEIQKRSIGLALQGKDILGAAQTGSGKTLAFLIPILENLFIKKWTRMDGVGSIIISPTRELAYQIFETLKKIGAHHEFSSGLIIGGKNLKFEKTRMDQCNIVICTPGRLLQHMDENPLFNCTTMSILVLDEADRCLDMGFADTMNAIIENLPVERQTLLFSATQTKSVKDLARLSLKTPEYIAPHDQNESTTPTSLHHNFIVINQQEKVTMLWSFIKSHLKQKSIVFLNSCKQVKYMYEIFSRLRPGVSLLALYGTLHQDRRMAIYDEFCRRSKVVLFATDIASRGLDFPVVSWVIQLDCPEDATAYIHRAGRTARHKAHGESLLVLTPNEEKAMLDELKNRKILINQISIDPKRLFSPHVKMEAFLAQSIELKESAQRAFVAYIKSIHMMKNKSVFNVESIDFDAYARSLGLVVTPRVRFLQRIKKRNGDGKESYSENEMSKQSIDLNGLMDDDDSDDDAGLMTIKRKNHDLDDESNDEPIKDIKQIRKEKLLTKAALAKKIIKKKIVANKKVEYDEEGNEVINTAKQLQSDLARDYEEADESGINIEKARVLLQEEDKFDKQRFKDLIKQKHREKKMKLKSLKTTEEEYDDDDDFGSGDSDDDPDLSWLPDYQKINGGDDSGAESVNELQVDHGSDEENDSDTDDDKIHKPPSKLLERKKRIAGSSEDEDPKGTAKKIKRCLTSKLNSTDVEELAMSLLRRQSTM